MPEWIPYVNIDSVSHAAITIALGSHGWRPLSVCMHAAAGGDPDDPHYTSVWVRWPNWEEQQASGTFPAIESLVSFKHGERVDVARATQFLAAEANAGRYPFLVAAAGAGAQARFAIYTSDSAHPARFELDAGRPVRESVAHLVVNPTGDFDNYLEQMQDYYGSYAQWIAPYGEPHDPRAAIIWRVQPSWGGVDETLRMVEVGILREDEPVELLEGVLVTTAPQGPLHAECTASVADRLRGVYADTARVREEKPIACDRHNLPEPDVAVVADKSYATRHPDGADVLLVVEVAWSSQAEELAKADVYARAGVPVYWLIDLASQLVHVFDGPAPGGYARSVELAAGDEVALPERDVAWPVAGLLSSE